MALLDILRGLLSTARDIIPISGFLVIFQVFVLKSPIRDMRPLVLGLILCTAGLFMFVQGLRIGLIPLGNSVGMNLPALGNPAVIVGFAAVLGFTTTLAEPTLASMAMEVEEISVGAIPNRVLVYTVALGVAAGMGLGALKILYKIHPAYLIIPMTMVVAVLGYLASPRILGIAFDAAGVTTGPVTVPINMALAIGLATVVGGADPLIQGFGVIALALLGPTIAVLLLGLIMRF